MLCGKGCTKRANTAHTCCHSEPHPPTSGHLTADTSQSPHAHGHPHPVGLFSQNSAIMDCDTVAFLICVKLQLLLQVLMFSSKALLMPFRPTFLTRPLALACDFHSPATPKFTLQQT